MIRNPCCCCEALMSASRPHFATIELMKNTFFGGVFLGGEGGGLHIIDPQTEITQPRIQPLWSVEHNVK